MAHGQFVVSDTNPNDTAGGGGCVCDPVKQADCKAPFAVFYGNDMENPRSPHVVICEACVDAVNKAFTGEIASVGEKSHIELSASDFTELPSLDNLVI